MGQTEPELFTDSRNFLQIFAFPRNYGISEAQLFAENRRKLQNFAETRLPHLVCPFPSSSSQFLFLCLCLPFFIGLSSPMLSCSDSRL